jgi:hypothetical protein
LTNYFQNLILIHKIWQKLTDFQTFFSYFHVVEHTRDSVRTNTVNKLDFFKQTEKFHFGSFLPNLKKVAFLKQPDTLPGRVPP